ncbi:hypothetical protein Tco_0727088 [Tanacetum coccineum]|uniref:Uncharacterized protein n=1 Tax=Tanacetum coccineum TaxID=301880 RepID=A0ABQ4YIC2_9ASTR
MGVTTTSPTPPWCGCGGHSRLAVPQRGGFRRQATFVVTRGGVPSQPDTTRCGCGGCHAVRPPPRGSRLGVFSLWGFVVESTMAAANPPPPTTHHSGGNGWKRWRRGGMHGDGGVGEMVVMKVGSAVAVMAAVSCGGCWPENGAGGVVDRMKMVERMV